MKVHAFGLLEGLSLDSEAAGIGTSDDDALCYRRVPLPPAVLVVRVACGYRHTALVTMGGLLLTFGHGDAGRLGHGDEKPCAEPRVVVDLADAGVYVTDAACGREHTVAVGSMVLPRRRHGDLRRARGLVFAWGWGEAGRLGVGDVGCQLHPVLVEALAFPGEAPDVPSSAELSPIPAPRSSPQTLLAPDIAERLTARRPPILDNTSGAPAAAGPQRAPSEASVRAEVTSVSCGREHTLCVTLSGAVYAFGAGGNGRMGEGGPNATPSPGAVSRRRVSSRCQDRHFPVRVCGAIQDAKIVATSAGDAHSVALSADGAVYTWGFGASGALGHSTLSQSATVPVRVAALPRAVSVSCGSYHTVAVDVHGAVWAWGDNESGQLGPFGSSRIAKPKRVVLAGAKNSKGALAVAVSCGAHTTTVLSYEGQAFTWGRPKALRRAEGHDLPRLLDIGRCEREPEAQPENKAGVETTEEAVNAQVGGGHEPESERHMRAEIERVRERARGKQGSVETITAEEKIASDTGCSSEGSCKESDALDSRKDDIHDTGHKTQTPSELEASVVYDPDTTIRSAAAGGYHIVLLSSLGSDGEVDGELREFPQLPRPTPQTDVVTTNTDRTKAAAEEGPPVTPPEQAAHAAIVFEERRSARAEEQASVTVLFDLEPQADGDLRLVRGHTVDVLHTSDDGWWFGRDGEAEGHFPYTFTTGDPLHNSPPAPLRPDETANDAKFQGKQESNKQDSDSVGEFWTTELWKRDGAIRSAWLSGSKTEIETAELMFSLGVSDEEARQRSDSVECAVLTFGLLPNASGEMPTGGTQRSIELEAFYLRQGAVLAPDARRCGAGHDDGAGDDIVQRMQHQASLPKLFSFGQGLFARFIGGSASAADSSLEGHVSNASYDPLALLAEGANDDTDFAHGRPPIAARAANATWLKRCCALRPRAVDLGIFTDQRSDKTNSDTISVDDVAKHISDVDFDNGDQNAESDDAYDLNILSACASSGGRTLLVTADGRLLGMGPWARRDGTSGNSMVDLTREAGTALVLSNSGSSVGLDVISAGGASAVRVKAVDCSRDGGIVVALCTVPHASPAVAIFGASREDLSVEAAAESEKSYQEDRKDKAIHIRRRSEGSVPKPRVFSSVLAANVTSLPSVFELPLSAELEVGEKPTNSSRASYDDDGSDTSSVVSDMASRSRGRYDDDGGSLFVSAADMDAAEDRNSDDDVCTVACGGERIVALSDSGRLFELRLHETRRNQSMANDLHAASLAVAAEHFESLRVAQPQSNVPSETALNPPAQRSVAHRRLSSSSAEDASDANCAQTELAAARDAAEQRIRAYYEKISPALLKRAPGFVSGLLDRYNGRSDELLQQLRAKYGELNAPPAMSGKLKVAPASEVLPAPARALLTSGWARVVKIACGMRHGAALTENGTIFSWGWSGHGRLGIGGPTFTSDPSKQPKYVDEPHSVRLPTGVEGTDPAVHVACGGAHTVVATRSGKLFAWGGGGWGQLGLGRRQHESRPCHVVVGTDVAVEHVACGHQHTVVIGAQGRVFAFGCGRYGRLGHGGEQDRLFPEEVVLDEGTRAYGAAAGADHSVLLVRRPR